MSALRKLAVPLLALGVVVSMILQFDSYANVIGSDSVSRVGPPASVQSAETQATVTSLECAQIKTNLYAHATITLSLLAELVFGNRRASVVIAEHAQALWVADGLVIFSISEGSRVSRVVGDNATEFRSDTQWRFGAAPSEYQIIRLVFEAFGFPRSAARRYMQSRPLPLRIPDEQVPDDYIDRIVRIGGAFIAFERRAVDQACPELRACLEQTERFQRPGNIAPLRPPPRNSGELDDFIEQTRGRLQEFADEADSEVVARLVEFWNDPSSESLWKPCRE